MARIGHTQRRIAATVDQLVDLGEELDFTDAAAPAFEVEPRAERLPLRVMIANSPRNAANLADRTEIERAPPHERRHRLQKSSAQRHIPRRRARADEGGTLPRQRQRFIIRDRRIHRQGNRRDFGRGAQAQIDAQHIPITIARLQDFDDAPSDPHRRFLGHFTRATREGGGVEQQNRIDIGGIVEFATALLAQRDRGEPARLRVRCPLRDRRADRGVERMIGEIRQRTRDGTQIVPACQIADRYPQREPPTDKPQAARRGGIGLAQVQRGQCRQHSRRKVRRQRGFAIEQQRQKGRIAPSARRGVGNILIVNRVFHRTLRLSANAGQYLSNEQRLRPLGLYVNALRSCCTNSLHRRLCRRGATDYRFLVGHPARSIWSRTRCLCAILGPDQSARNDRRHTDPALITHDCGSVRRPRP